MDSFTKLFSDMVKSGVTPQRMLNTAKNPTPTPETTDSETTTTDSPTTSAATNPQITPEMQDQIKGIGLLLAAAMRKSLALLQEEQQERDFIEEEVKPEYKEEKLKEVEQKFLQKRTTLIEELMQALAVILAFLNILPGHEKFSTAIESNIQALTETIRMIVYTTPPATKSTIDSTAETTALVAQKKGDVTHFRGNRPIFGGGEKGRMETTKDNGSQVHLNGNFDATGIDFVIEKVAENPSERKVTIICDAKFLPITKSLGEKLAREKGYQPENIHFKIKDDKTGEIPKNTSFTYAQLSSAIEEDKKKAQETAAVTAAEKTTILTAELEQVNATDPVFIPTSTPQQRLDALAMEPPGLQRDAKLTSLVAKPEYTATVLVEAKKSENKEVYNSLMEKILDQPPVGLLATLQKLDDSECKKDVTSRLLTQSPRKTAQLMNLANKKGDETTLQLFANPATVLGTEKSNYAFEILDEYNNGDDVKQHLVSLGHDSLATSAPTMQPNN